MSYARRAKKDDPLYAVTIQRNGGRCEATTGERGNPLAKPCLTAGNGVFIDEQGHYVCLCNPHRLQALEYTSDERKASRKAFREAQLPLLPGLADKRKDD